jgi:uncharacterized protein
MIVSIISDIHDNPVYLEKFLNFCRENKIGKCICCGDVGRIETIKRLSSGFAGDVLLVKGNLDNFEKKELIKFKNITFYGEIGNSEFGGYQIGFCHEPFKIDKTIKEHKDVKIVFYGHTHKPWIEVKNGVQMVNPGTMGGIGYLATIAMWDTDKKEIKLIKLDETNL